MYQNLSLSKIPKGFRGKPAWYVQLWWLVQFFLFRPSPQFMYGWRRFLLRMFGAKIGCDVKVRPTVQITYPWKISIGDFSWVGDDTVLYSLGNISIGSNTAIAHHNYICTGNHDYTSVRFDISAEPVHIGNEVWITTDIFIAPGVTIGDGTVVGARSTVLNDLPAGMVCYGSPAMPVKPRVAKAT